MNDRKKLTELMSATANLQNLKGWEAGSHFFPSSGVAGTLKKDKIVLWFHPEDQMWSAAHSEVYCHLWKCSSIHEALVTLNGELTRRALQSAAQAAEGADALSSVGS